jgi:hypothetical protein
MAKFTPIEIQEIDRIWRDLPSEHLWNGWAAIGNEPSEVWLYRKRQNWRRFLLTKHEADYLLTDDQGAQISRARKLSRVLCNIEIAPGLAGLGR